jgi:hypothetical protein
VRETTFPDAKQEITVPLRDVEIGEHMARYVQDFHKPLAVGQVVSEYPSPALTHDRASRISEPFSKTAVQTMSIGRTGLHEREPVSPGAIPWRYSFGRRHSVTGARMVPEGRFGNAQKVRGSQHAGAFLWVLLTGAIALAASGAAFAQDEPTSAATPESPETPLAAPIGPPSPERSKQFLNWETGG